MTSKQRVKTALAGEQPDRVPLNYMSNPTVHARLAEALGCPANDYEAVLRALDIDIRGANARYAGPSLFSRPREGRQVNPVYGFVQRWVKNESGGYWDFCDFPLMDAEPEQIAAFPIPSPDDFDHDAAAEKLAEYSRAGYGVAIGNAGMADIINSTGRVMGMEDTLVNLQSEDEATLDYIDRRCAMELGVLERTLDRAAEFADFFWMGEDLGTQRGPLISLELYRRVLRPRHQQYIDLAKSYGLPVMIHCCGSSSWAFEDFCEMGINAVDTLQPEAADMSPAYLKARFGGRLSFHGCISTSGPLAYGTEAEIRKNVRDTLDIMMPGGGYLLSPTHAIQDNTPVRNIIALYDAAKRFGMY